MRQAEPATEPYWWDEVPPAATPPDETVPRRTDVLVVGAGYTGLMAGLELARAGRSVLVLDALRPGEGASARNGGMIGHGHRVSFASLKERYGEATADGVVREGLRSLRFTTEFIEREGIACCYRRTGRFRAAWTDAHYEAMAREGEEQAKRFGVAVEAVPAEQSMDQVATRRYRGGCIFHEHGALQPALFHDGLLGRAREAGARVLGETRVQEIERAAGGHAVLTSRGPVHARNIVIATNGYTTSAASWLARRVVPVPSFVVATEPLGQNRVKSLIPSGRMIVESRAAHCYYRPSPDGMRLVFGGRAALHPVSPQKATRRLKRLMTGLFPDLADVAITHSWTGNVAFTRQEVPAIGRVPKGALEGAFYAMGYNGSGVAMAPYLGYRVAHNVLNDGEGRTGLDDLPMNPVPFYDGKPWFMRALDLWYQIKDKHEGSR